MSHFARVNNGIVEEVLVADQDFIDNYVSLSPGDWIKTSYNTKGGIHYEADSDGIQRYATQSSDQSKALRKNYAEIGGTYDVQNDAFIPRKRHRNWTLNTTTFWWEPPITIPDDGLVYAWSDDVYEADDGDPKTQGWVELDNAI